MKILVYGIGAMGSIYASLLSRSNNEVFVIDNLSTGRKEQKNTVYTNTVYTV